MMMQAPIYLQCPHRRFPFYNAPTYDARLKHESNNSEIAIKSTKIKIITFSLLSGPHSFKILSNANRQLMCRCLLSELIGQ